MEQLFQEENLVVTAWVLNAALQSQWSVVWLIFSAAFAFWGKSPGAVGFASSVSAKKN